MLRATGHARMVSGQDFRVSKNRLELDGLCRLQRNSVDPERRACEVKNIIHYLQLIKILFISVDQR